MTFSVTTLWNNLFTIIKDNITDPEGRGKRFVFASYPDKVGGNFPGFPIIIVNTIGVTTKRETINSGTKNREIECVIDIHSNKVSTLDILSDDVINQLETNESTLNTYGLYNMKYNMDTVDIDSYGKFKHIHKRSITFRWNYIE